ncbi:helix-turn-helix transcriptional regulator [Nonomuraea bangladeshensis]|uniref:Helix-turn-helix transcriptional regulator n=1 Tax=Nonomuraea bangladeshensis TaxID=404385 RepID=A0ABV3H0Z1_9ACTN
MVGGRARSVPPRDLAQDPENWPHADLSAHPAAAVVQAIAAALVDELVARRLSRRGLAAFTGVNRQSINTLISGCSWPDVATIAQLEIGLDIRLWPGPPDGSARS